MILLELFGLKKYYGDRLILEVPQLSLYSGDRIGIVGENGAGKTTLMALMAGSQQPEEGKIQKMCQTAYLRQFSDEPATIGSTHEFLPKNRLAHQQLSGGEQTRLKIDNVLSQNSCLLLADEPTSNLDGKGIQQLTRRLKQIESFVLISHDRQLLNTVCNKIWEIKEGKITEYSGNYSSYQEQKQIGLQQAQAEYQKYTQEKARLQRAITGTREKAKGIRKAPRRMGNSEARLHKREATESEQKLHSSTRQLSSRLERLEKKEKPKETPKIKLDFSLTDPPENKIVLSCKGLTFGYGQYPLFENVAFEVKNHTRTAVIGENGAGKTTLLGLIAQGHSTIKIAPKAKLGFFQQGFENLQENKTVLQNALLHSVQPESTVRTVLARLLLRGDAVEKTASVLSGGEKVKLSLAQLLVSDANVLLLDEPTNYLDLSSIEAVQDILKEYPGVLLFVSHDTAFVNTIANRLLLVENKKVRPFEGNLSDFALKTTPKEPKKSVERLVLETRLTRILSQLSLPGADKESLEQEYLTVQRQLKELNSESCKLSHLSQ